MSRTLDRMREELELLRRSDATIKNYLRCVRQFLLHFWRPPEELDAATVRGFVLHLMHVRKIGVPGQKLYLASLKFLYERVVLKPEVTALLPWPKVPRPLPIVLSSDEVRALLTAVQEPRYRAMVACAYGAGLRVSEILDLRPEDVDSSRGVLHIRNGKGQRARFVMLGTRLLAQLRDYWRACRPPRDGLLFPGATPGRPARPDSFRAALRQAAEAAGITKTVTPHLLRHCFATHLLERGVETRVIQILLGHASIATTTLYLQVGGPLITKTVSPLDRLEPERERPAG